MIRFLSLSVYAPSLGCEMKNPDFTLGSPGPWFHFFPTAYNFCTSAEQQLPSRGSGEQSHPSMKRGSL